MNVTLLLLSSACIAGQAPVVVSGAGCNGCGSSTPTFASATFAASACGSCGTATAGRVGLFDRLKGLFHRSRGCDAGPCGNAPAVAASPCGATPCGTPLRSSFVPTFTATAAPNCCGPVLRSSFPIGSTGCCDAGPTPRVGLFARLRARLSGGHCHAAPECGCGSASATTVGCTPTVGTVGAGTPTAQPPVAMPKPQDPMKDPPKEPAKDPKKEASAAPVIPVPADLPRIPTLNGASGN